MWILRAQFSKKGGWAPAETPGELEWNEVHCETIEEAEQMWKVRTSSKRTERCVSTMYDPQGRIVRVKFH